MLHSHTVNGGKKGENISLCSLYMYTGRSPVDLPCIVSHQDIPVVKDVDEEDLSNDEIGDGHDTQ